MHEIKHPTWKEFKQLRKDRNGEMTDIANEMIVVVVTIFLLVVLAYAFTYPLTSQVNTWKTNLTAQGQAAAATVVGLIPTILWILVAIAIILLPLVLVRHARTGL